MFTFPGRKCLQMQHLPQLDDHLSWQLSNGSPAPGFSLRHTEVSSQSWGSTGEIVGTQSCILATHALSFSGRASTDEGRTDRVYLMTPHSPPPWSLRVCRRLSRTKQSALFPSFLRPGPPVQTRCQYCQQSGQDQGEESEVKTGKCRFRSRLHLNVDILLIMEASLVILIFEIFPKNSIYLESLVLGVSQAH